MSTSQQTPRGRHRPGLTDPARPSADAAADTGQHAVLTVREGEPTRHSGARDASALTLPETTYPDRAASARHRAPGRRRRVRVPSIVQLTQTECGLVCALMLLRAHGSREPIKALRTDFEVGRDGLSLQQVRDLLRSRGLTSKMFAATLPGLRRLMERDRLPVIVYWRAEHFVVLERLTDSHALIVDPSGGRRRLSIEEFSADYSQRVVTAVPGPDFHPVQTRERNPWLDYLKPARAAWRRVLAVAALSVLVFGSSLVAPTVTRWLIDQQVAGDGGTSLSVIVLGGLFGFAVSLLALSTGRALIINALNRHIGRATMHRVFGHLLRLPYRYFASRAPGELLFRLNSVNAVRDLVSTQLAQGVLDLGMSLAILCYMIYLSPQLTLVAIGFYLLIVAVLVLTRRRVGELTDSEMSHTSRSQSLQLESIVGAAALRMSGDEDNFHRSWGTVYDQALAASQRRANFQGVITSSVSTLQIVAPTVVLLVGINAASEGTISVGSVVAFQAVASMFFGLATSVFGCWSQLIQGRSYLDRLSDITEEELPPPAGDRREPLTGKVEVKDVGFRYSAQAPETLSGIDLAVRPGQRVAIVGASGSGKSTLGKILCGLLDSTDGTVTYDGHPITEFDRRHFHQNLGYVPQEVHLLNRSLLENITMGNTEVDTDAVLKAVDQAQLTADVQALPMGLHTLVAEMGANFSGGQRQRLAVARALVKSPKVLILDEATSALDSRNEARINEVLQEASCTQIVIAHRLSTVVDADVIHVMEDGQIVQSGTHADLSTVDGPYRRLFAASLKEAPEGGHPPNPTDPTPTERKEQ